MTWKNKKKQSNAKQNLSNLFVKEQQYDGKWRVRRKNPTKDKNKTTYKETHSFPIVYNEHNERYLFNLFCRRILYLRLNILFSLKKY